MFVTQSVLSMVEFTSVNYRVGRPATLSTTYVSPTIGRHNGPRSTTLDRRISDDALLC